MNLISKAFTLSAFVLLFMFSSCAKDVCYECTGFDDGTTSLDDATICEGENTTKQELEAAVTLFESLGGTCKKQ